MADVRWRFYYGCWGGTGHYLWTPRGHLADEDRALPWAPNEIDPRLAGDPALVNLRMRSAGLFVWDGDVVHQPEGMVRVHRREGWTALAWWDRSLDRRFGSNVAFFVEADVDAEEVVRAARETFPHIFARFTYPLVLPLRAP